MKAFGEQRQDSTYVIVPFVSLGRTVEVIHLVERQNAREFTVDGDEIRVIDIS